jgi:hypothetical protein
MMTAKPLQVSGGLAIRMMLCFSDPVSWKRKVKGSFFGKPDSDAVHTTGARYSHTSASQSKMQTWRGVSKTLQSPKLRRQATEDNVWNRFQ